MESRKALDTNVLVYLDDAEYPLRRFRAKELLNKPLIISALVMSEYLHAAEHLFRRQHRGVAVDVKVKLELLRRCRKNLSGLPVEPITLETLVLAEDVVLEYELQMSDSVIVASALETGCKVLYSEDMRHDLLVFNRLRIINPFEGLPSVERIKNS
jgi:predicted nucleic acid-binding protein